jgi:hypothetical protein
MNMLRVVVLATALGLTLGACGKRDEGAADTSNATEAPATGESTAGASDPEAASSPHQQEATGTETPEAAAGGNTDPGATATPSQQEATQPPQ